MFLNQFSNPNTTMIRMGEYLVPGTTVLAIITIGISKMNAINN